MYSTCLSCRAPLGRNELLERFPVSRRVAFDPAKGRLWALCRRCRSWNLAPIEERWEAVEDAERLFQAAAVLSSTENVALGRTAEGTELVRVGRVDRRELAMWRYGERLVRRWRKYQWYVGGAIAAGMIPGIGLPAWPVIAGFGAYSAHYHLRPVARLSDGRLIRLNQSLAALLLPESTEAGWSLAFPRRSRVAPWREAEPLVLRGDDALRILRTMLPRMNWDGGCIEQVWEAVGELNRFGSPERVLRGAAHSLERPGGMDPRRAGTIHGKPNRISTGHPAIRLALEMVVNEEAERRALAGELGVLEREWKEAEELASIADDLLLPGTLRERLRGLKARSGLG